MELLKAKFQTSPITSLHIDLTSLKKLVDLVKEINLKAKKLEEDNIRINSKDPRFNIPDSEVEKYVSNVLENYIVSIEITEFNGNYSVWYDSDLILKEEKFPDGVRSIRISNVYKFLNQQNLYQFFKITINLDFTKTTLLDFFSNPSQATYNQSYIEIGGLDQDWVTSSFASIKDFVENRKNNKSWIHKRNVYDVFLWFIIIPLIFWNLQKVEIWLDHINPQISGSFTVFILIYAFLIGLIIFSFIFKYARWLYPPVELFSRIKNAIKLQRLILFLIAAGILVKLVVDIVFEVIPFLLK